MPRKKSKSTKEIKREKEIKQTSIPPVSSVELQEEEESPEEKRNLKDLAKDIIASYEARVAVVGNIVDDTHKMMTDFRKGRENMSGELQELLAKCESLRKKDFSRMMADIVATQNERERQVKEMLENFRKEEEAVAEKLKNILKKGEEIRLKDFKKMMVDIKEEQMKRTKKTGESITGQLQKMQEEVHSMLDNFKKERMSVATAWHEMLGLFRGEKLAGNPGNPEGSRQGGTYGAGPGKGTEEDIKNNDDNE